MGRQAAFKTGGGFLNGVDGVIVNYEFSDEFNGKAFVPGKDPKTGKEFFHGLFVKLTVRVDGATEDTPTTLRVGDADKFAISDEGHTITPVEDGFALAASQTWPIFLASWEKAAETGAENESYEPGVYNYEGIIGSRCRFEQQPLSAAEIARMKAKGLATTRKGKVGTANAGKEFPITNLVVTQVYELASVAKAAPAKAAGKAKAGKVAAAPAAEEVDIVALSGATLAEIVKKAGGSIEVGKIGVQVLTTASLKGNTAKPAVREFLTDLGNIAAITEDGVLGLEFNSKKGIVVAATA